MKNPRYRHLVVAGLVLLAVANLALGVALLDNFFLVRAVVCVAFAGLALRFDRWWAIVPALVLGVAMLAETVTFFVDALGRFDTAEFGFAWANVVLGIGISAFATADLIARRSRTSDTPAPNAVVTLASAVTAALVVGVVASAIATVAGRDTVGANERAGALTVTYEDLETKDTELTANAGEPIRIVVDNKDVAYHNFELAEADVRIDLSARESKLVEFTIATPGAYEYKCTVTGHDKMKGTLTIK